MSVNNGKVTAPVGWDELGNLLGCAYEETIICKSPAINPNSKYKPTRWPQLNVRNSNDNSNLILMATANGTFYYWQGQDGFCGFSVPTTSINITDQSEDAVWSYLPPRGGSYDETSRADDFIGYNHNAPWDWGLPTPPSSIVAGGNSFRIGFNLNLQSENGLCYADFFKTDTADATRGIYVSFANANASSAGLQKKVDVDWTTGKATIELTRAEITSIALTAGQNMRIHFYGMRNGRYLSLRNNASVQTFYRISVVSSQPYSLYLRGSFLHLRNSYNYYIYNLAATVDATSGQGGTLAAGSRVQIYKEVPGTSVASYRSLYSPIWDSGSLSAVTVSQGSSALALNKNGYTLWTDTSYGDTITAVVVIWYDSAWNLLANTRVAVQEIVSAPA